MVHAICTLSNVGNIFMMFHEDILNGFQVTEQTALYSVLSIAKDQRGITKNIYILELWFLWSAHRVMLVNISIMFHEDILNGFQVTYYRAHGIVFCSWHFSWTILCQQVNYRVHYIYVGHFHAILRAGQLSFNYHQIPPSVSLTFVIVYRSKKPSGGGGNLV